MSVKTPTNSSWSDMRARCLNPNHTKFPMYGGKGITVCERWSDYSVFLADMGERPCGKTLDRIDGTKGYSPGNCRWATPLEQQANIKNNRLFAWEGETLHLSALARRLGLKPDLLRWRIERGWPESAWSLPAERKRARVVRQKTARGKSGYKGIVTRKGAFEAYSDQKYLGRFGTLEAALAAQAKHS